jgi:2-polyprenyl-6-methoxyphenol hydroxylase-like FAD-dependent oxidoreductase
MPVVLIVGGGIAGAAAALALGKAAIDATLRSAVLAESLRDAPDRARAFIRSEQLRRDRVQANITASARMSSPVDRS